MAHQVLPTYFFYLLYFTRFSTAARENNLLSLACGDRGKHVSYGTLTNLGRAISYTKVERLSRGIQRLNVS